MATYGETGDHVEPARRVSAGVSAGIIGGVMLALLMMILSALRGQSFWMPMKAIAALFVKHGALDGGAGVVILGIVTHLVIAALLGLFFAYLLPDQTTAMISTGAILLYGIAYGLAVLLVMTFLVLPWADPTLRNVVAMLPTTWLVAHVLYGVGLALTPAFMMGWTERGRRVRVPVRRSSR